jgi:hypothetical protein
MKHIFIILVLLISISSFSQRGYTKTKFLDTFDEKLAERAMNGRKRTVVLSCRDLISTVIRKSLITDEAIVNRSSFILGGTLYNVDGINFVVMKIKTNEGYYREYIFCDVQYNWWLAFKEEGGVYSWGEAYHKYIEPNKCNCN